MKNRTLLAILLVITIMFAPLFPASAEESVADLDSVFVFPCSLQWIEDEAFEGTAVGTIVAQEGLLYIGENAFANNHCLTDVCIPQTTEYIADAAFSNDGGYTLHGVAGSYAEDWAKENRIPFDPDKVWRHNVENSGDSGVQGIVAHH